jgi:toxin ParE1/3/4
MSIEFFPEAEQELDEAFDFYKQHSSGLASTFLLEVSKTIARLEVFPASGAVVRNNIRRALVHHFPYGVFYCIDGERILILSAGHLRRRPTE